MIRPEDLFINVWHKALYGDGYQPGARGFKKDREYWMQVWLDCVALVDALRGAEQAGAAVALTMMDEEVTKK